MKYIFVWWQGFYLYLYIVSMVFLLYMYAMLLKDRASNSVTSSLRRSRGEDSSGESVAESSESGGEVRGTQQHTDTEVSTTATERDIPPPSKRDPLEEQVSISHCKLSLLHSTLFSAFLFVSVYSPFIIMLPII